MRWFDLFGAVAILALAPATGSATTINFDVDGNGVPILPNTPISNQYANLGVTFVGLENGANVPIVTLNDPTGVFPPSFPNLMSNCSDGPNCSGRADIVRILFDTAVSGFRCSSIPSAAHRSRSISTMQEECCSKRRR